MWLKYWASWGSGVLDRLHTSPLDSKGKFLHEFKKPNVIVSNCPFCMHFKGNQ
jgi:hypothetical protein